MGTWGELLVELNEVKANHPPKPGGKSPHDLLRLKYLNALHKATGRAVIVYATCWLEPKDVPSATAVTINLGDIQGFMEACSNVEERELDLILTSPGGSPEAAEQIMTYLRTRFDHIRCYVPVAAMSAATMMALACDEIVMASHSQLGPIDPQFTIHTPEGPRSSPAQAIIDQFEMAKAECKNPANIGAWMPLLRSLSPGLLAQCDHSRALAEEFVQTSLGKYMFAGRDDGAAKAETAAKHFADFKSFKSHSRGVPRDAARLLEIDITDLEADHNIQDLVLSVHHATRHTFSQTPTTKIVENHHGRAYIEMASMTQVVIGGPPGTPAPVVPAVSPALPPPSP